jgi:hypothetical protein
MIQLATIGLTACDVTGQRRVSVSDVSVDTTINELLGGLTRHLELDRVDRNGNPLQVEARLEREGRALRRSERVGDALQPNDHLVLHPRVMAG